jgi:hypothetical protein
MVNKNDPIKLYRKIDDAYVATVYACCKCGIVRGTYDEAESCCREVTCLCGKVVEDRYRGLCRSCREKKAHEGEMARWAAMPDFKDYSCEPIYDGTYYHADLESYIDAHIEDNAVSEEDIEEYLEVCEIKKFGYNVNPKAVLDYMNEKAAEDLDEGYDDTAFVGEEELVEQIKAFLEKQKDTLWVPIGKKIHTKTELEKLGVKVNEFKSCDNDCGNSGGPGDNNG